MPPLYEALATARRARPLIYDAMMAEKPSEERRLCEQAMHLVDAAMDALNRVVLAKMQKEEKGEH